MANNKNRAATFVARFTIKDLPIAVKNTSNRYFSNEINSKLHNFHD